MIKKNKKFNSDSVINEIEAESIIISIAQSTDYDGETVFGLFTVFSAIKLLIENDHSILAVDLCDRVLDGLFPYTSNFTAAKNQLAAKIAAEYRKAEFSGNYQQDAEQFLDPEDKEKENVLDLSAYSENLNITSEQFSEIINDKNLPEDFKTILEKFCEVKQ